MQSFIIALLLLLVIIVYKYKKDIIIYLPLVNIFLDLSLNFFQGSGKTSTGLSIPAAIRLSIYLIIVGAFVKHFGRAKFPKFFWVFSIYIFILCFFSSDIFISLKNYTQLILSLLMFPIGYLYFSDDYKLKKFLQIAKFALLIYITSLVLGNFFGIGTINFGYSGIEESVGFFSSGSIYAGSVLVALLPIFLLFDKKKSTRMITIIMGIFFILGVLFTARRTSIMIPFIGLFVFLFFSKMKAKIILMFIIGTISFLLISPFILDRLTERLAVRAEAGRFDVNSYEQEARYFDLVNAWNQATNFDEPLDALFGTNIFAEGGWRYGVKIGRIIHNDYAVFLQGGGIIGLILYLVMILSILFINKFQLYKIRKFKYNIYYTSIICLIAILLAVSLNGGYNIISYRALLFLLLGAFVRLLSSQKTKEENARKIKKSFSREYSFT
mgnify:CR=1 FL=1